MKQNDGLQKKERRLYVLVSKDLTPVYGCVQAGHCAVQYVLDHPGGWRNEFLIYVYADIEEWIEKLEHRNIECSIFREPDLGNKITAIAVEGHNNLFSKLPLVK